MIASRKNQQDLNVGFDQQVLNISSIGVLITAVSDSTILYANKVIARLLGIKDADSIIGTPVPNFYWEPKDRQIVLGRVRAEGSIKDHEVRIRQSNGNMLWVSISIQSFELEGEQVLLSEIADITERKRAKDLLQSMIENAPEAIGIVDLTTGLFSDPNENAVKLYGLSREELVKVGPAQMSPPLQPDGRPSAEKAIEKINLAMQGEAQVFEWTHCNARGENILCEVRLARLQSNPPQVRFTVTKITERKKAEAALLESEERFRRFTEATVEGLVFHENGRVTDANPAGLAMFGIPENAEFIGRNLMEFIVPESHKLVLQQMQLETVLPYEIQCIREDGSIFPVETSTRTYKVGDRTIRASSIRDISERKQAGQALQESQRLLQLVMDNIPQSVFWKDKNLTYLGVNQAFAEDAGFASPQEIVGRSDFDMPWKEQAELYRADDQRVLEGGEPKLNYEEPQTNATGKVTWLRTSKIPMRDANGQVFAVLGMYEDITESKQAELALKLQSAALESAVNSIVITDRQGSIIWVNPAFTRTTGFSAEEVIGKNPRALKSGKHNEEFYREMWETILSGQVWHGEIINRRKDGSHYSEEMSITPVRNENGEITHFAAIKQDISERKQAELALRESQQLLQLVMDNIPQSVFWKDKNLTYLGVNQSFAEDAGFASPQEIVGKTDFELPWKQQAELYRADDQRVLDLGETKLNYEEPQTNATGKVTWLRTSKIPMRDANGQIFAVLGMYEDITEQKQMQQKVGEAFERRGFQVQISTEISQEIASASELSELFERVVTQTKERLGYYHTQLLHYDPAQDAVVLISGYGETGQKMLAGGHKMPLGSGLIGTAAASGQTVMRPTLTEDPDWQPNSFLPDTKGEIAVPIKLGEQVLGVLDVQSDQAGALSEDDRLLLEGLCGQIAVAMEQTRLRQEMAERLEEVNRLYLSMSQEGWKTYRETTDLPAGFIYDQAGLRALDEEDLADELFANIPMRVPGGEVVGTLAVADDPRNPTSDQDRAFLQQVSDQIALAMESARLAAQTQTALSQTEKLSEASLRYAQSANLQELLTATVETLGIPVINRSLLGVFNYNSNKDMEDLVIVANWWNGSGHEPSEIGRRYTMETLNALPFLMSTTPVFSNDTFDDERITGVSLQLVKHQNIRSMAVLPLFLGSEQTGVVFLESEETHNFSQSDIRLFTAMAPQIATVLENRRQFERAQKQAERESTLNVISQKIQSATTVEAVLQIAARELGHALGAPMTIAQLSMKDKK